MNSDDRKSGEPVEDRLVLVFAPGLWPYRSTLDAVSWRLAEGVASSLSLVPGLLGYASPRALVDPEAAEHPERAPVRVLRSLPPIAVVRGEAIALGASFALTGRILRDREGFEIWLNCLDGPTGDLLWTSHVNPPTQRFIWHFVGLLRRFLGAMRLGGAGLMTVHSVASTGSWEAFVSLTRARSLAVAWDGRPDEGTRILALASRALAHDPGLEDAEVLLSDVGAELLSSIDDPEVCERAMHALAPDSQLEPIVALRRSVHDRLLALAHPQLET